MRKPKIGVVGFGHWGKNQARVFDQLEVLTGIYDTNLSVKKNFHYNFFEDLDNLIEEVDGLVICTPANTHFDIAKKAIKKTDILVEKPLALRTKEVEELIKLEKKSNKLIMTGHQLHFHPAILEMKKIINSGEIGEIKWIYSNRLNMGKIRPYENVLWSFAPHDISLMIEFINSNIKKIEVQGMKILNSKIEDTSVTLFEFNNKVKSHIFVSWIHPFKEQRFVIVGDKGSLVFSDTDIDKLKLYKTNISEFGEIDKHIYETVKISSEEPLKKQGEYFLRGIQKRKIEINNSIHALKVVQVLEECSTKMHM